MKRIARKRPKIGRVACPTPIPRFIIASAEALHLRADEFLRAAVKTVATPLDLPGAARPERLPAPLR